MMLNNKVDSLSYSVRLFIEKYNLLESSLVLSVSGGQDSMVLLYTFLELQKKWKPLHLKVFHVHHGETDGEIGGETESLDYRNQARDLVQRICRDNQLLLLTNSKPTKTLSSEEELRNYRKEEWLKLKSPDDILVTAHHQDDQFETRLHRLLRGTGIQGLVGMETYNESIFRPFLQTPMADLARYASEHGVPFQLDPTNKDTKYFRNWLRHELVPKIESYQEGTAESFRQSLENIAGLWKDKQSFYQQWIVNQKIKRQAFLLLDQTHQMQLLSYYLQQKTINEYRRSQLEEITKLLDRRRNDYRFKMLGHEWIVSAEWVEISLLD